MRELFLRLSSWDLCPLFKQELLHLHWIPGSFTQIRLHLNPIHQRNRTSMCICFNPVCKGGVLNPGKVVKRVNGLSNLILPVPKNPH